MLGRFEILGLLSVGGMAEIYLARSEGIAGFEKLVVIKRMLPHFAMQAEYVDMFLAEARLGAVLDHPNVVAVHDIGEETGNYYYAMEYVRGADLSRIMQAQSPRGPMPLDCAIAIVLGLCAGLDHAHELGDGAGNSLGVVHRDVSLSNVLVSYDGAVKVTDFGVAKQSARNQTQAGTLKGKLGYMSPEQCRGYALDRRSDIFSIGIILYELSTGQRLFRPEESDFAVLEKIVKCEIAPPSRLRADYPAELEAIVMRALHRDRDQRYQTARELQRDLELLAHHARLRTSATELAEYLREQIPVSPPAFERQQSSSRAIRIASTSASRNIVSASSSAVSSARNPVAPIDPPDADYESVVVHDDRPPRLAMRPRHSRAGWIALSLLVISGGVIAAVTIMKREDRPSTASRAALASLDARDDDERATTQVAAVDIAPAPMAAGAATLAMPARAATLDAPAIAQTRDEVDRVRAPSPHRERDRSRERDRDRSPAESTAAAMALTRGGDDDLVDAGSTAAPIRVQPPVDGGVVEPAPIAPTAAPVLPAPRPAKVAARERGSLDAVAAVASVNVKGPLQDSEIRRGIGRATDAFRSCYRAAARDAGYTPAASVRVTFEIDDTRAARNIHAAHSSLPGLSACVEDAAAKIRTRIAPDVGNAQVTITVSFAPTSS